MLPAIQLNPQSDVPLYRQLYEQVRGWVESGRLRQGERVPATRELAAALNLNRTTVSAAYALLEKDGLLTGHVGRGSFIAGGAGKPVPAPRVKWEEIAAPEPAPHAASSRGAAISFANSRPAEDLFPVEEFRMACREVLESDALGHILQLGSPAGYPPLRHYLLEEARRRGVARAGDDIIITSGCQQALDLVERVLTRPGDTVLIEDPVYPGLRHTFARAGARVIGAPTGDQGVDLEALERAIERERPRLVVVTPNFQNPTGTTLTTASRVALLAMVRAAGAVLVENDAYGELRYVGEPLPNVKQLDETGDTVLLGSFSKIAFPGLRIGWVIAPRALIARLMEAKQWCDLHTDQLSQAVAARFAASGRLAAHRKRVQAAGARRLAAVLSACERHLPAGAVFTRPQGGMNLWVRLPEPLDAAALLPRAEREGVGYLPGKYFAVSREHRNALRLSFAGLDPGRIRAGVSILGSIFSKELELSEAPLELDDSPALV